MNEDHGRIAFHLLYGPPASGKTDLALRLKSRAFAYISTGEITRREIAAESTDGKRLKYYLDNVLEYPSDLIAGVLRRELAHLPPIPQRVILDGFPKYRNEVDAFREILAEPGNSLASIIVLECSLSEVLRRVRDRRLCLVCGHQCALTANDRCPHCNGQLTRREDDDDFIIRRRYSDYCSSLADTLEALGAPESSIIRISATDCPQVVYTHVYQQLAR